MDRRSDYTYAQEYKGEIQRVIEETRQHVSKWRLYPAERLLNTF